MKILAESLATHPRRRNIRSDAIHCKHRQGEQNPFPELRNPKYILKAGEHALYHLCLAACSLDLVNSALAELMSAND